VPGSQPGAGTDWRPLRRALPQIFITDTIGSVTLWVARLMVLFPPGERRGIRGVGGISAQSKFGSGPKWSHEGHYRG
jgi:hypothetical protein